MAKKVYPDIQSAAYDIYRVVERYMTTDGMAWLVGKLKNNIVRTVYRRMENPDGYRRTEAFKNSVRGRVFDRGKNGTQYKLEIIAFPDSTDMSPRHTSWINGEEEYNGMKVNEELTRWLEKGHKIYNSSGILVGYYRGAKFIEKTEEEMDDPKGFFRGMLASLRKAGFKTGRNGGAEF